MKEPTKEHMKRFNKKYTYSFISLWFLIKFDRNLPVVPVVVDPILASKMRPHQREGKKRTSAIKSDV